MPIPSLDEIYSAPQAKPSLDEIFGSQVPQPVQPSSIKEWAKAGVRGGVFEPFNMVNRSLESASNRIGQAFDVAPEDNAPSRFLKRAVNATEQYQENQLGKNKQWVQESPVQNFVQEQVEGALPYVITGLGTGGALPLIEAGNTDARITNKLMDKGMSGNEAMSKAVAPALVSGGMFAAMGPAKKYVMGGADAAGKFVEGKAVNLLAKPLTKNPIVGDLTKAASPLQAIGREAAFISPYLHTQGEAVQGAELLSGASTKEEYQQAHGYNPEADMMENIGNVGLQQLKSLGTSALVGAGFGVPEAMRVRSQAKQAGLIDAATEAKEKARLEAVAKMQEVSSKQESDIVNKNLATDLTGSSPTLDEQVRVSGDLNKLEIVKQEFTNNTEVIDQQLQTDLSPKLDSNLSDLSSGLVDQKTLENQANPVNQGNLTGSKGIIELSENGVNTLNSELLNKNEKAEYHAKLAEDAKHPTIQSATNLINTVNSERGSAPVAPEYMVNAVKKIHASVKNVKEFTAELVKRFGESIKQHAIKLWHFAKQSASWAKSKLKDTRGLVGRDINEVDPLLTIRAKEMPTKEDFQNNEVLPPDNNQDRSSFHKEQFEMQKWLDRKNNHQAYEDAKLDDPSLTPEVFYKRVRKGEKVDEHDTAADLFDSELYNQSRDDYNEADFQTDRVRRQGYDNSLKRVLDEYDSIASSSGAVASSERKLGSKESAVEDYGKKSEQKINQLVLQMKANKRLNSDNVEFKGFGNLSMTEYAKRLLKEMTRYDADGKRLDIDAVLKHIEKKDGKVSDWREYPQSLMDLERYLVGLKTKDGVEPALRSERAKSYEENEQAQMTDKSEANTKAKSNEPLIEAIRTVASSVENPKSFAIRNATSLKEITKDPNGFIESFDHYTEQAKRGKETDVSGVLDNKKDLDEIRSLLEDYYDPDAKKEIVFTDEFIKHFGKNVEKLRKAIPDTGDLTGPLEKERLEVLQNAGDKSILAKGITKEEAKLTLSEKKRTEAKYESWKEIATGKMKGVMDVHGTLADFFDTVLATKKDSKGDFLLDHKDISDRLAEKNKAFGEKSEEERLALVQKLFDATTVDNGTWEAKSNREDALYAGVSENAEAKRQVTQLGEESEKYTADYASEREGAQLKLLHVRGEELKKYDVPENAKAMLSKMETLGLLKGGEAAEVERLLAKMKKGNPVQQSSAKRDLFNLMTKYKVELAKKAIENASVVNPKFFEKQAADNKELGYTPAEHYKLFLEFGGDKGVYASRLNKLTQERYQSIADKAAAKFTKDSDPKAVRDFLTTTMDEVQKKAYESYVDGKETDKLSVKDRILYDTVKRAENEIKALGYEKASPASAKYENQIKPNVGDYFTSKQPDAFEKSLGVQVGKLRNKVAQKFYELIAKAFDADLVVVSDPEYKSRYKYDEESKRGKLVINVANKVSFARMFAHELFHHVVRKAVPEEYKAFQDGVKFVVGEEKWNAAVDKFGRKNEMESGTAHEELMGNLFEQAVMQKGFYERLSDTFAGKSLAGKILSSLINRAGKVFDVLKPSAKETGSFSYEKDVLIDRKDMDSVHELIGDLLGSAYKSTRYNKEMSNEMFWTDISQKAKEAKTFASDKLNQTFPEKTRKGIFESIGKLADKALTWIKENKPKGMFSDFMADPEQIRLASKVMHGLEYETAKAYHSVVAKYKDVWKGMTNEQLESIHDKMVRGKIDVTTEAGKEQAKKLGLTEEQVNVFAEYKNVSDALHVQLSAIYPDLLKRETHYGQSIRWFKKKGTILDDSFDWVVSPEFSKLEGSKHYLKEKDENRTTKEIAEQQGLEYNTINPHELFIQYVREANKLLKLNEMVKEGQDADAIRIFTSDFSAAKEGFVPISDNSSKVFQKLNPSNGYKILTGDGYYQREGHEVVYNSEKEALADIKRYEIEGDIEGVKPEKDNTTSHWSVMRSKRIPTEDGKFRVEKDEVRSFSYDKEAEALAYADKLPKDEGVSYGLERGESKQDNAIVSRMYFKPDLARMINVVLAPDRLRNGSFFGVSGHNVMALKNTVSNVEFAWSMFHAMTIGQETVASTSGWAAQRYGKYNVTGQNDLTKKASGYNPLKAVKEAKDIDAIFKAILSDEKLAYDPAIQKKMDELLGTHNVDTVDIIRQFFNSGGLLHMDESLKGGIDSHDFKYTKGERDVIVNDGEVSFGKQKISLDEMKKSIQEAWDTEIANNGKWKGGFNAASFVALKPWTQWLMSDGIPKIKMAAFAREYSLKVDKNKERIQTGEVTKEALARDTMKFIEDRFGEVNWKNMWMDPSIKTALQFAFRSFTWFTGSWKALGKAGIDIARAGLVKAKGGEFELTEKGLWGVNALITHALTAGLMTAAYQLINIGTEETPTEDSTPTITKALFPRVDPHDPTKRLSIPSYVTEGYKIMNHLGMLGNKAEPSKLVAGRFNSLIGKGLEVWNNEDFRGVTIHNREDNYLKQSYDMMVHMIPKPIFMSSIQSDWRDRGFSPSTAVTSFIGMTDAPASAKRSAATNLAFEKRREEYKGKAVTPEQMDEKDVLKRAMYAYQNGDKTKIDNLLHEGKISKRQYDIAMTRIPLVNGKKNAKYKDPLSQAMQGLTMEGALKVWNKMDQGERAKHKGELMKKYINMNARHDKSPEEKIAIRKELKELGVI